MSYHDARIGMIESIKNNFEQYGYDRYYRLLKLVNDIEL
jgi:tRNA G10  N-methylase Trm11